MHGTIRGPEWPPSPLSFSSLVESLISTSSQGTQPIVLHDVLRLWSLADIQPRPHSGENAATALENNLTTLESKIDELLASFERSAAALPPEENANGTGNGTSGVGEGGSENKTDK